MRKLFVFLGVVLATIGSAVSAQEVDSMAPLQKSSWGDAKNSEVIDYLPDISLDMRSGFGQDFTNRTGRFYGDGLYLDINGYISPHFSYSLNQRLASTYYENNSGFNGTNWLTLTYEIGDFAFTAGKDALLVGSFEYDAYDLDSYYEMNSTFYNYLDCWQWGVSATWYPAEIHSITIQAANSPFWSDDDLFSYALGWRCEGGVYESYWTANLWEYEKGRFMNAINLGNRLHFGGFSCDLEYMRRATGDSSEYTLLFAPSYEIGDWCRAFGKIGYEKMAENAFEYDYVGENIFYGLGVEFFPLKEDKDIRIHAAWSASDYIGNYLNLGLTWKMDLTRATKYLFHNSN